MAGEGVAGPCWETGCSVWMAEREDGDVVEHRGVPTGGALEQGTHGDADRLQ